jgi:Zinc carboxypeptidase
MQPMSANRFWLLPAWASLVVSGTSASGAPAAGPLRVHPTNPRYFTDGTKSSDGSLRAVYLTGSHTWGNLCDYLKKWPPFDYPAYLDFLDHYNHNFIRLWSGDGLGHAPTPYARIGPGTANDGGLKVDLPVDLIETAIENGSPLWYEAGEAGAIHLFLNYDHERQSPNRAAGHIHFRVEAKTGSRLTLEFRNLDNIYNGKPGSVAGEMKALVVSEDGRQWRSVATRSLQDNRALLDLQMAGPKLYVARVEPYRLSDLEALLDSIRGHPRVKIDEIGKTVEGRSLEIIRIGEAAAPHRVFLRARAHPWEAGTNWVVQGLIRRLVKDDAEARRFLRGYCVYIMPMANKDGVARGRTRFNSNGKDLNREWNKPADPHLAPENHALEQWIERMIAAGQKPDLALELHNDGNGKLHISRPPVADLDRHLKRMATLESLLRKHTWFTEGSTGATFRNIGTLGDAWLERYAIDSLVHEFNCQWSAGLGRPPLGRDWERYGEGLARVFEEYFAAKD